MLRQVPIELLVTEDKPLDLGAEIDPRELIGCAILVAEWSDGEISSESLRRTKELMAHEMSLFSRAGELFRETSNAEKIAEIARKIGLIDPKLHAGALKSFLNDHPEMERLLRETNPAPAPDPRARK